MTTTAARARPRLLSRGTNDGAEGWALGRLNHDPLSPPVDATFVRQMAGF
jgi:hypothetical protein